MATINAYSVGLHLDAANYIHNSNLSRKETAQLKRDINSARTPAENYQRKVEQLGKALKAGAIDQKTYNRLLSEAKTKYSSATKGATDHMGAMKKLAVAYVGFATVSRGVRIAITGIKDAMEEMDKSAKSARAINESVANLERFKFAISEFTSVSAPAAIKMLTNLSKRIGESALDIGTHGRFFESLGLDLQQLALMTPTAQFRAFGEALGNVESETEQLALATQFLGLRGAELLPILRASRAEYEASASQADKFGLAISDIDAAKIESANDAMGRVSAAARGLFTELSVNITPAIETVTQAIVDMQEPVRQLQNLFDPMAKSLALMAGQLKAVNEQASMSGNIIKLLTGTTTEKGSAFSNLFGLSGLFKARAEIVGRQNQATMDAFGGGFAGRDLRKRNLHDAESAKLDMEAKKAEVMKGLATKAITGQLGENLKTMLGGLATSMDIFKGNSDLEKSPDIAKRELLGELTDSLNIDRGKTPKDHLASAIGAVDNAMKWLGGVIEKGDNKVAAAVNPSMMVDSFEANTQAAHEAFAKAHNAAITKQREAETAKDAKTETAMDKTNELLEDMIDALKENRVLRVR